MNDTVNLLMYTVPSVHFRTDNPEYMLIGKSNDLFFGQSNASFIAQAIQTTYPNFTDLLSGLIDVELDSICLIFPVNEDDYCFGDENSLPTLSVYQVEKTVLSSSENYYSDADPNDYINSKLLGNSPANLLKHYIYNDASGGTDDDPNDTTWAVSIKLLNSIGQDFIDQNESYFYSAGVKFYEIFYGIYVTANSDNNSILRLNTNLDASMAESFGIVMFYHKTGSTDPLVYNLPINTSSARFNLFTHDYSTTSFYNQILNPGTISDTVAYLQSMAGTSIELRMPGLENFDSVVVNKAELIIKNTDESLFPNDYPIEKLWLVAYDSDSALVYFDDFLGASYEGASITDDKEYHFYVTRIVQNIIDGVFEDDLTIHLINLNSGSEFTQSIINTGQNSNPAKLVLTYTKY